MTAPQSPPTPSNPQWAAEPSATGHSYAGQPYAPHQAPYGYPPVYAYPREDPGKTLGIVGFVMAFVAPVVGIVLSAMGSSMSKAAGFDNQLARWGLGLSIAFTALTVFAVIAYVAGIFAFVAAVGT